jgi:hypothetical protein
LIESSDWSDLFRFWKIALSEFEMWPDVSPFTNIRHEP